MHGLDISLMRSTAKFREEVTRRAEDKTLKQLNTVPSWLFCSRYLSLAWSHRTRNSLRRIMKCSWQWKLQVIHYYSVINYCLPAMSSINGRLQRLSFEMPHHPRLRVSINPLGNHVFPPVTDSSNGFPIRWWNRCIVDSGIGASYCSDYCCCCRHEKFVTGSTAHRPFSRNCKVEIDGHLANCVDNGCQTYVRWPMTLTWPRHCD